MFRRDYIETFEGKRSIYLKGLSKSLLFSYKVDKFETKKSRSLKNDLLFQKSILSYLQENKKKCFRNEVVVHFTFNLNQQNPPSVQSLLKHYIDLIYKPIESLKTRRKYLFLKDDNQIKGLSTHYWLSEKSDVPSEIKIWIKPYKTFLSELNFGKDLQNSNITSEGSPLSKSILYEEENENSFSWFQENIENSHSPIYDEFIREMQNQEMLAMYSHLKIDSFLYLLEEEEQIKLNSLNLNLKIPNIGRIAALKDLFSIDLGSVPVQKGDTTIVKAQIKKELEKWKTKIQETFPQKSDLSLKLFYEKPIIVNHDLDNLLKIVLPLFYEIMIKDRDNKSITIIEVYKIRTIEKNQINGRLYLKIEDLTGNDMFYKTGMLLEKFEKQNGL